ncbi:hypothetical protein [Inconstantimicrobium mannanitabidum]|uniref:Uncharacterized protein n=1 Tax=Inconstantimicrobium mannanitabidum TaxID=1604901 RepID=A0ACB5R9Z8_9CLOT|nr:hypothetical protein [Clostridium sp. TW13]GKX66015.1 hypothetical protein rsdtw13_12730 [Clostridium sp. TW13]
MELIAMLFIAICNIYYMCKCDRLENKINQLELRMQCREILTDAEELKRFIKENIKEVEHIRG